MTSERTEWLAPLDTRLVLLPPRLEPLLPPRPLVDSLSNAMNAMTMRS